MIKIKILSDLHRSRVREQKGRDLNSDVFAHKVQTSGNCDTLHFLISWALQFEEVLLKYFTPHNDPVKMG